MEEEARAVARVVARVAAARAAARVAAARAEVKAAARAAAKAEGSKPPAAGLHTRAGPASTGLVPAPVEARDGSVEAASRTVSESMPWCSDYLGAGWLQLPLTREQQQRLTRQQAQ